MTRSDFILLPALFLMLLTGCSNMKADLVLYDLRCENLYEPLGIATANPGLSWKIRSGQNMTGQKAFQIIAATNEKLLRENKADLWNSGKIISGESVLVPWNGEKLTSGSFCCWKVRVWDENDCLSDWSESSCFSIGLLDRSDWKAGYIGISDTSEYCISPQLRKIFTITDKRGRFFLHVNSLGYHEVWLNGEKVGENVLAPAVSQFNKRSLTLTYDISSVVRKGRNDLVLWLGQGWYSEGMPGVYGNVPLVRAQAEQIREINHEVLICTDSTWTGRASGYSTIGNWRPHQFGGEFVDGSLLLPDLSSVSLDNALWRPVITATVHDQEPSPQTTEPNRIIERIKPKKITSLNDSIWLVDMGTTLTGWFGIHFPVLTPGQVITMEYSDHLDKNGNMADQGQRDIYRSRGTNGEFFSNKFNYHGFRYVKISNLADEPMREKITACLIHTNYKVASSFKCSDPDLNEIHDMIFYTLRCLSLGGYLVDCPQIERLGYGGDGNASTLTAQIMFDMAPLYANWLQAWADCVRDDGSMPHTAPNPYSAGGGPYWCGFIITASWKTYQSYGDIRFLEKYYPVMQKWLGYAEKYSPAGLLEPWPETDYRSWYLGDWAVPEGIDQTDPASIGLVNNCFLSVCYETMNKIALVLGNSDDAVKYAAMTEVLKKKIRKKFFDPTQNIYGSGSQIDLTYPLLSGVVPDSLILQIRQNLIDFIEADRGGHFACGLVGVPVFTEWATKNREADLMYSMLKKRDYPGYLYMIDNGATTTWEHWNGARSRIHNCYNGIGSWFYEAIGGIRQDENYPGYRHFLIDPQIPDGITWAMASKETPYGTIISNWRTEAGQVNLEVKIPVGCKAMITIPDLNETFTLNGENLTNNAHHIELRSGEYNIAYKPEK